MMGSGYGGHLTGPSYEDYWWQGRDTYQASRTVTEKEAASIARNYMGGNPNLQTGEIADKGTHFEGEIVTRECSLASRLTIDKDTGLVHPLYQEPYGRPGLPSWPPFSKHQIFGNAAERF